MTSSLEVDAYSLFVGTCSLGALDPDLYTGSDDEHVVSDDVVGRLRFSVEFDPENERLLVTVIRAKHLTSSSMPIRSSWTASRLCDSYVR